MITVRNGHENYEVSVWTRPPSVYLDHWALRLFSSDSQCRDRFLTFFKRQGTLLFSLANLLEISRNTGESLDRIRSFLDEIGEQWFPIEFNPIKVIEREAQDLPGKDSPCFAQSLLEAYYPHIHEGRLGLSAIVDLISDGEVKISVQDSIEAMTTNLRRHLDLARDRWRSDLRARKFVFQNFAFNPHRPETFVFNRFMQLILKESFILEDNDIIDLCHAAVSLAYGDFVLLDKQWANLAQKLGMPSDFVRVYSPQGVDEFMNNLERVSVAAS